MRDFRTTISVGKWIISTALPNPMNMSSEKIKANARIGRTTKERIQKTAKGVGWSMKLKWLLLSISTKRRCVRCKLVMRLNSKRTLITIGVCIQSGMVLLSTMNTMISQIVVIKRRSSAQRVDANANRCAEMAKKCARQRWRRWNVKRQK